MADLTLFMLVTPRDAVLALQGLIDELEAAAWGGARRPATRERAPRVAEQLVGGGL